MVPNQVLTQKNIKKKKSTYKNLIKMPHLQSI